MIISSMFTFILGFGRVGFVESTYEFDAKVTEKLGEAFH